MNYKHIVGAAFLERPNRFVARTLLDDGREVTAHVKNTGRCKELLIPGARVYLEHADNPARKTAYSLIAVEKGERLVNMDSQAPNKAVREALESGWIPPGWDGPAQTIRSEAKWGNSRLDFILERGGRTMLMEVKGVTLEEQRVVRFPDAPTQRGVKHIGELVAGVAQGYDACALFVVQMGDVDCFQPNDRTHPAFGNALRDAFRNGVRVCAITCKVTPHSLALDCEIPIAL